MCKEWFWTYSCRISSSLSDESGCQLYSSLIGCGIIIRVISVHCIIRAGVVGRISAERVRVKSVPLTYQECQLKGGLLFGMVACWARVIEKIRACRKWVGTKCRKWVFSGGGRVVVRRASRTCPAQSPPAGGRVLRGRKSLDDGEIGRRLPPPDSPPFHPPQKHSGVAPLTLTVCRRADSETFSSPRSDLICIRSSSFFFVDICVYTSLQPVTSHETISEQIPISLCTHQTSE